VQAALVDALADVEHKATLNLRRLMRLHPLEPWRAAQRGAGEKQFARLLAAVGDPYWNTLYGRPRTVSELWAFCGLHTISPGGDQTCADTHLGLVAARRQRGQRANWSTVAKSRAYLIAAKMLMCGNRELYDTRKAATADRVEVAAAGNVGSLQRRPPRRPKDVRRPNTSRWRGGFITYRPPRRPSSSRCPWVERWRGGL
jgi:hypothetical protein